MASAYAVEMETEVDETRSAWVDVHIVAVAAAGEESWRLDKTVLAVDEKVQAGGAKLHDDAKSLMLGGTTYLLAGELASAGKRRLGDIAHYSVCAVLAA
jgi:hypothetical protein